MKLQLLLTLLCISLLPGCGGKTPVPQSHYADYNGHKVHYQIEASGSKTIIFIHGWSCDREFWKYQIPAFTGDYRVILIDLPGHGKSDAPDIDYTLDAFADAVKAVLDDSGTAKAVVVGHSMGFAVAWQFAIKYPANTAGVCSVDGAFFHIPAVLPAPPHLLCRCFPLGRSCCTPGAWPGPNPAPGCAAI